MRSSDRKDIFAEKFSQPNIQLTNNSRGNLHKSSNSGGSYSSFEEGLLMRNKEKDKPSPGEGGKTKRENGARSRTDTESSNSAPSVQGPSQSQGSPSDSSFTLGGSAVWVGDESGLELAKDGIGDSGSVASSTLGSSRKRRSTGASSSSSQAHSREHHARQINASRSYYDSHLRHAMVKDTHFHHTTVTYRDHPLPIKMPLATFPEEVGDVCRCVSALYFLTEPHPLLVLANIANQSIPFITVRHRTISPTPAHERTGDPPNYHSFQRLNYRKTDHIPWS